MKKRLLAGVMALCLTLTLLPARVLASEAEVKKAPGVPNPDSLRTNEDFKPYDPHYPKKDQFGDYVLRIPDLKGRLTFKENGKDKTTGTLFAPGVTASGGWKNATKKWHNYDSGLCFAASVSNLLSWYLNRYNQVFPGNGYGFETEEEKIFDHYRAGWDPDASGEPIEALSWYFTGRFPSNNPIPSSGTPLTGKDPGAHLWMLPHNTCHHWSWISFNWKPQEKFEVYGSYEDQHFPYIESVGGITGDRAFTTWEGFSEQVIRQLHYGPTVLSIVQDSGPSGHAITLWGVDYDVETGLITKIHVTDSDDAASTGLFSVPIVQEPNGKGFRMVNYPYHPPTGVYQKFTRIRDSVMMYGPDVVRLNKAYTGEAAIIQAVQPDADGLGVRVQVSNLSGVALEYGYSHDAHAENVAFWQADSHFTNLLPDQYYFFARVKETTDHAAGGVSAPHAYQVKLPVSEANLTLKAPVAGQKPENAKAGEAGYTVESTTWQPQGDAFQHNTQYTVTIRLKADTGHIFTDKTLFTLNKEPIKAVVSGDTCEITYNGFPKTDPAVTPIAEANLKLKAPVAGQKPENAKAGEAGYTVESTNWQPQGDAFQHNTQYTVTIRLKADAGHIFTDKTLFTLNKEPVKAVVSGDTCVITYNGFPKTDPAVTPIAEANLKLKAPVAGQKPENAKAGEAGYTVESTTWQPQGDAFQHNTQYTVTIRLKADASHTFTDKTIFTLNGKKVTAVLNGDTCVIDYNGFPKTDPDSSGGESGETPAPDGGTWLHNNGQWWYRHADGSYTTNDFEVIDGQTYYFGPNGYRVTDWQTIDGTWYYFSASGHMLTGWQWIGGSWYYLDSSGAMLTGWQAIRGSWYYLDTTGAMLTGWQAIHGNWYYLDSSGAMLTGWQAIRGSWYYLDTTGAMLTGWQQIGGNWYYLDTTSGAMLTGWQWIGGNWYYLDTTGAMLTGWQAIRGSWYYLDTTGAMLTGWQRIGGIWYYLYTDGHMAANEYTPDGYYVNGSGAWV